MAKRTTKSASAGKKASKKAAKKAKRTAKASGVMKTAAKKTTKAAVGKAAKAGAAIKKKAAKAGTAKKAKKKAAKVGKKVRKAAKKIAKKIERAAKQAKRTAKKRAAKVVKKATKAAKRAKRVATKASKAAEKASKKASKAAEKASKAAEKASKAVKNVAETAAPAVASLASDGIGVGDVAPSFELSDQDGNTLSSSELAGKPYVIYFYPKDDTPGCTREACGFRDEASAFAGLGVRVIGVSPDSVASHRRFADKHGLEFTLLSDPDKTLIQAYGSWILKKNYGREYWGVERSTFVVGADGIVTQAFRRVRVDGHVDAVREAASALG